MQVRTKKYYISLIIAIVGLLSIISGSSYAILKGSTTSSKEQVIKSGNVELTLTEHYESINKPLSVLKDEDGLLQEETYSFNVKNTGSGTAKYNLKLVNSAPSSYTGSLIDDKYIKIGIEVNGKEEGPYTLSEVKNIIDKEVIYKGEVVPYKLRIWLNSAKESELENLEDAKVYLKLELEIEQSMGQKSIDTSGANAPELTENMIPVYYDETKSVWKKADVKNIDSDYRWYDYNNKIWANAVTVTEKNRSKYLEATSGTEIPMSDINTMWVWMPRYTYTYLNTNTPEEIKIKFEKGTNSTGTIKCTDAVTGGTTTISQTCTDTTNGSLKAGTSTYTHPAFTFGDKELTGLWVGKFESSATTLPTSESTTESTVIIKPNVQSLRNKAVSYFFRDARQMEKANNVYGFPQSNNTTFNWNGNLTGDTNNIDIHMMKNTEWGAVTYLYHSKYGRCTNGKCEELTINNCSTYTTGIGADEVSASYSSATCTTDKNKYNRESGVKASTTGNVYGVYDMSGGSWEYAMGNMVNTSTQLYPSNANNWTNTTYPLSKYYDSYTYNNNNITYTKGRLGDATVEMAPTGTTGNWYSDSANFPNSSYSWFQRGGGCSNGPTAGAFFFNGRNGSADNVISFRASIVPQAS